jgi:GAF domain-containing protein
MTNISKQVQLIEESASLLEGNQEIESPISQTQDIFKLATCIGNLEKRDRLQLIELLSSQAAISLENTHIYAQELEKTQELHKKSHLLAFRNAMSHIASHNNSLESILIELVETVVNYLDAAFARIWLLNADENVLELRASAGMYTHIDGLHKRVPVGKFKIGLIAEEKLPHITNNVLTDARVSDKE